MIDDSELSRMDFLVARRLYSNTSRFFYNRMHRDLENLPRSILRHQLYSNDTPEILEVGAGSGEHLSFIKIPYQQYTMIDVSELGLDKISKLSHKGNIRFLQANVEDLPFNNSSFDRVVSTCVLAHVENPLRAMSEIRRVLRVGGTASLFLSADPSIMLRTVRKILVEPNMRDLPLDYGLYNALSHRNSCSNLLRIAKHIFKDDYMAFKYEPIKLPIWNISTHVILHLLRIV